MKKILILYFSGVGATKKVAEYMYISLSQSCTVDKFSMEESAVLNLDNYDALVIGLPVYHAAPPHTVTDYLLNMYPHKKGIPVFIFNTRTVLACNTNRILAKLIRKKNIVTIMDKEYRSPASDGSLIVPFVQRFFEFEKDLQKKITLDCTMFLKLLQSDNLQGYIPRFRFSSIMNAPNKLAGQLITLKIYLHRDRCVKCGNCIENCPRNALKKDENNYPVVTRKSCENCYRCIHHCPAKALSLSKRTVPKRLLNH